MPKYIVQLRRGTTEEWKTIGKDIVPLEGELVLEYDNGFKIIKIGTDEVYDEAVDVEGASFTYKETDVKIEEYPEI